MLLMRQIFWAEPHNNCGTFVRNTTISYKT
ncbi:hypothetical protein KL86DES1_21264 [uncultured Desulfovibrio sp.]|uniref:Uncharacterized protein n=1 Tax=uncultured Desulfovibrio sp. TaxID=167968 RepID=A0A212L753_9BACT|nr:hypothetical protein KL86DES1_21264 [uncultured Desulfovibrio sp.]VZH34160.1 conserved protein of unknown function [Desulfovibrio sp. 86]